MKNKLVKLTVIGLVLMCTFVIGATGTIGLSDRKGSAETEGRLIGLFAVFGEEVQVEGLSKYVDDGQRYLYATRKTVTDENGYEAVQYVFEQLQGVPFFNIRYLDHGQWVSSLMCEKICDVHSEYSVNDQEGDKTSHSGTLYLCTDKKEKELTIFPVRQTSDERVYIDTAEIPDVIYSGDQKITLTESYTFTKDKEETTESMSFTLDVKHTLHPSSTVKLIEMNGNNEFLKETVLSMDETIADHIVSRETEYVIVEQQTTDGNETQADRKLYTREDERAEAFTADDDGICSRRYIPLVWQ